MITVRRGRTARRYLAVLSIGLGTAWLASTVWARDAAPPLFPGAAVDKATVGCFKDAGDPQGTANRDLDGSISSNPAMTNSMCLSQCSAQGFQFGGTQAGTYCFCGNSYGKYGPSNGCSTPCAGDRTVACGGIWANSIYFVKRPIHNGGFGTQPPAWPPPPPSNGGQCVITINGTGYTYKEEQRWEIAGPPMSDGAGGKLYPLNWKTAGDGNHNGFPWTVSGGGANNLWVHPNPPNPNMPATSKVQRKTPQLCTGVLSTTPPGPWCEYGTMYPSLTVPSNALRVDDTPAPFPIDQMHQWGYQQGSAAGSATCQWHVTF